MNSKQLASDQVLVTVGTPCSMSAVGSTETYQALVTGAAHFIACAAFDAGLIEFDPPEGDSTTTARFRWAKGERAGQPAGLDEIEARHGAALRANLGIRCAPGHESWPADFASDLVACLPHDLEQTGLRRLAGITYQDVRESSLRDMFGLFDDDPRLGPTLQAQLFVYAGMGALAALPKPLSQLLPDPYRFRVSAATAFPGLEAIGRWNPPGLPRPEQQGPRDRFALRLAGSLASHGPALLSTMLAPAYSLSRALKNPALLGSLRQPGSRYLRVPQAPMTSVGACASSLIGFCEFAPQMLLNYPGYQRPLLALWTAADAGLRPDFGVLEAFGSGALMSRAKLRALNAGRPEDEQRSVANCLAPFDVDANGTVIGNAGSGVLVTTLDFAMRNFLDVTSLIVGWGQSGEAGGKAHFAGVGFGGENAILQAFDVAHHAHGYGAADFQYLVAHATGTRTNSKTDLTTAAAARAGAAELQHLTTGLPVMHVGAPKAAGDGHSMGETGLKAISQAIQYVLGQPAVGVPTLRRQDPELGHAAESFLLRAAPVSGNRDGGALCATQGFGGYNGAIALRSAHSESLARYASDPDVLSAYLERWPQLRREREQREAAFRRRRRAALQLAELHCWRGLE
jgi:3-oxoacyl-[acyl-carrier-protein] synthase II